MGLVKFIIRLMIAWVAFLHPCFASYKALSHRPVSEPDLERWVKYWSIVGALVGVEYALEWLVSWLPFYWEIKMVFVLYLALPQTQGSTFIYDAYLAPYFTRNETAIDANIATARRSIIVFLQEQLQALWGALTRFLGQVQAAQTQASQTQAGGGAPAAPAAGSPANVVANLWRTYGSSVMAGITRVSAQAYNSPAPQSGQSANVQSQSSATTPNPAGQAYTRSPYSTSGAD